MTSESTVTPSFSVLCLVFPLFFSLLFTHISYSFAIFSLLLILPFLHNLIHSVSLIICHLIHFCIPSVSHTLFVFYFYFLLPCSLSHTLSCAPFPVLPFNHFSVLSLSPLSSQGPFLLHSFTLSSFLFSFTFSEGSYHAPLTLIGAHQETCLSTLSGVKPPSNLVDYYLSKISGYLHSQTQSALKTPQSHFYSITYQKLMQFICQMICLKQESTSSLIYSSGGKIKRPLQNAQFL